MSKIDGATSIYYTMVDRDLSTDRLFTRPITSDQLRFSLKLHSLLFSTIVIPDGATLYNENLRELVLASEEGGDSTIAALLQDQVIVWSQRSNAPSFSGLHDYMVSTHSWNILEGRRQEQYIEYLEQHCQSNRLVYDFETTATSFTALTEACLSSSSLADSLGFRSVAATALERSRQSQASSPDGYARRTAIFRFADQLDTQGRTRMARHLRQVSSVIYHTSAALDLGLPIGYSDQYSAALVAIHGVDVTAWHAPSAARVNVVDLPGASPFQASAIALMDYDAIRDIRRSRAFKRYQAVVRAADRSAPTRADIDRLSYGLLEYLEYLSVPLGSLLAGRYSGWKSASRATRISTWTGRSGSAAIALVTGLASDLAPTLGLALSTVWGLGGWRMNRWLGGREEREAILARGVDLRLTDAVTINASGLGG